MDTCESKKYTSAKKFYWFIYAVFQAIDGGFWVLCHQPRIGFRWLRCLGISFHKGIFRIKWSGELTISHSQITKCFLPWTYLSSSVESDPFLWSAIMKKCNARIKNSFNNKAKPIAFRPLRSKVSGNEQNMTKSSAVFVFSELPSGFPSECQETNQG